MANSTETSETVADNLFDKYTLPKIALAVILTASFVGTAVTVRLSSGWALAYTAVKWGYFVSLGILTGGLLWKHVFVRPQDLDTGADEYCEEMYGRFDRIAVGCVAVLVPTSAVVLYGYITSVGTPLVSILTVSVVALTASTVYLTFRDVSVEEDFRNPVGVFALALALSAVLLTAVAEVSVRTGGATETLVRGLHLLAFAVWVGGAVWNIFVAVPTGQEYPTSDVIRAAGEQLERFRWAVRFIIPTLVLTGLYQAVDVFGYEVATYLSTPVGIAVAAKLGFIGLLVVIFKLCPMWRACSPIDGVCDLEDIGGEPEEGVTPDGSPTGEVSDD